MKNISLSFDQGLEEAQAFKFLRNKDLTSIDISNIKQSADQEWFNYQIDNSRQTILTFVSYLYTLLDSSDMRLVSKGKPVLNNFTELVINEMSLLIQRQFISWNILAGYLPSVNFNTQNDWTLKTIHDLHTITTLSNASKDCDIAYKTYIDRVEKVTKSCNVLIKWAELNHIQIQKKLCQTQE